MVEISVTEKSEQPKTIVKTKTNSFDVWRGGRSHKFYFFY